MHRHQSTSLITSRYNHGNYMIAKLVEIKQLKIKAALIKLE